VVVVRIALVGSPEEDRASETVARQAEGVRLAVVVAAGPAAFVGDVPVFGVVGAVALGAGPGAEGAGFLGGEVGGFVDDCLGGGGDRCEGGED